MGDIEKRLNQAAVKKGTTWGTAVDTNAAGMGILPLNAGAPKGAVTMVEDETYGAFEANLDVGLIPAADFSLDFDYRFDGRENLLLAMLFGTAGAPTLQDALAYLHSFVLLNKTTGIFGTYATEKNTMIHTVPSFKVLKGTFTLANGLIKAAFALRGNRVTDASALPTAFDAVTYLGNTHVRAKFSAAVFQMNAQGGADFDGDADIVRPKTFTLEVERKMDAEHVAGSQTIVEPVENDKPSVKLTMEFPRMDSVNADYFAHWIAATEKKAELVVTGPAIEAAHAYYLKFQFPRLAIEDVDYADSKIIPAKIVLRGLQADAAPTGMAGVTVPVVCQVMNLISTNYLA